MTSLAPVGRAAREPIADRPGFERWHLASADERVARRLLALGADGVGGFIEGTGTDQWVLVRAPSDPTLAAWLSEHKGAIAWPEALALITSLAEAIAACEKASLFPGPIHPDALTVRDGRLDLRADSLVHALVGAGHGTSPSSSNRSRWLSPAQADGAPADSASNRYAIGLLLYRLLAGEHPFTGIGLRRGLEDQSARGAPPMPPEIELPVGLQSLCLRLLDPDATKRPRTAHSIVTALGAFLAPSSFLSPSPSSPVPGSRFPVPGSRSSPSPPSPVAASRWLPRAAFLLPLTLALAGALALAGIDQPRAHVAASSPAAHDAPLTRATQLSDCASCHPRQSTEWSRSVMAHATGSPLYQSLEMLIEEQVGRTRDCPDGAGILRSAGTDGSACINRRTGIAETGSGGELWCVNCHAPGENLARTLPAWSRFDASTRRPLRDLLPASAKQGISCAFCHQVTGPARPGAPYEGNPSWTSPRTGERFSMRPEDDRGRFGIANSGYLLDVRSLVSAGAKSNSEQVAGGAHRASSASARAYLGSSEFCGSCHDVRLFGTDAIEGVRRGEHFKRLRNAYSEWVAWSDDERRAGRVPASCQDCHMSLYPGVCAPGQGDDKLCPTGTRFEPVAPGTYARGSAAANGSAGKLHGHTFTGVDLPLDPAFDARAIDDATLDVDGVPLGARQRRDLLLARTFRLSIDGARRGAGELVLPITVENVGAGHRVPAGFSQEREFWLHVKVSDARGVVLYESGRVDRATDDLRDKVMLGINTRGTFGADVADGPDVPRWTTDGDGQFRGRGLVNFQNGFLRCVRCIGEIDARGRCQPLPGQERARADRYADGDYDPDTGECRSNLRGENAFVEIYFPVGSLDASRGEVRGPDAIVDTRSLPPNAPQRYVHELDVPAAAGPLRVEVTLRFRAFPPYLIRAFIDYEREQQRLGLRAGGVLVDARALERLDIVDVATTTLEIP